jgi:hypothetical protein
VPPCCAVVGDSQEGKKRTKVLSKFGTNWKTVLIEYVQNIVREKKKKAFFDEMKVIVIIQLVADNSFQTIVEIINKI